MTFMKNQKTEQENPGILAREIGVLPMEKYQKRVINSVIICILIVMKLSQILVTMVLPVSGLRELN